jgi:hypothetical protein
MSHKRLGGLVINGCILADTRLLLKSVTRLCGHIAALQIPLALLKNRVYSVFKELYCKLAAPGGTAVGGILPMIQSTMIFVCCQSLIYADDVIERKDLANMSMRGW